MNVSLIIATYNWPEALSLVLSRIENQTIHPNEIIIADDGSDSRTLDVIESFRKTTSIPVIHIWHEDRGFRKVIVLNKAISRVSYPYVIQIDGDIIPSKRFIEDHLSLAEKGCFIRGARTILDAEASSSLLINHKLSWCILMRLILKQNVNTVRLPLILQPIVSRKEMSGHKVKGCNMAFWLEDLIAVNGYNAELSGWGHEDEELCCRLVNLGVAKKIIKMSAIVYHLFHKELSNSEESDHNEIIELVEKNKAIRTLKGIK